MIKKFKQILKKHRVYGKLVQTHTINNPKISDINRIFYNNVINHNEKNEFYTNDVIFRDEFETIEFFMKILQPMT